MIGPQHLGSVPTAATCVFTLELPQANLDLPLFVMNIVLGQPISFQCFYKSTSSPLLNIRFIPPVFFHKQGKPLSVATLHASQLDLLVIVFVSVFLSVFFLRICTCLTSRYWPSPRTPVGCLRRSTWSRVDDSGVARDMVEGF